MCEIKRRRKLDIDKVELHENQINEKFKNEKERLDQIVEDIIPEEKSSKSKTNGLNVKVYKLSNNKHELQYRVIVRRNVFGKILFDGMFFTKEGLAHFIDILSNIDINKKDKVNDCFKKLVAESTRYAVDKMMCTNDDFIEKLNSLDYNDKDQLILFEQNFFYVYTGGCEGLRIKHGTNGIACVSYNENLKEKCETHEENGDMYYNDELIDIFTNDVKTTRKQEMKSIDNIIIKIKHFIYMH